MSKTSFPERTLETIRQACRLEHPLSGHDAALIESALQELERKNEILDRENDRFEDIVMKQSERIDGLYAERIEAREVIDSLVRNHLVTTVGKCNCTGHLLAAQWYKDTEKNVPDPD